MMKGNRGVTLVALVITIIVLLILAGVSISLVVGDNGVLSQAVNAANQTNLSTVEEQMGLAVSSAVANYVDDKYLGRSSDEPSTVTVGDIETYLDTPEDLNPNMSSGVTITDITAFSDSTGSGVPEGQREATVTLSYNGGEYTCKIIVPSSGNTASVTDVSEKQPTA